MAWLIAFLILHTPEIAAIGATAYTVSQVTSAATNTIELKRELEKKEEKK